MEKPSYKELERRIKDLEHELDGLSKDTESSDSSLRLWNIMKNVSARHLLSNNLDDIIGSVVDQLYSMFSKFRISYSTIDNDGILKVFTSHGPSSMPNISGLSADLSVAPLYLKALKGREIVSIQNVGNDKRVEPLFDALRAGKTKALLDVPILHFDNLTGLLCIDSPETHEWKNHEISLMRDAGDFLSLALRSFHEGEERQKAENELRLSEKNYRDLVESANIIILRMDKKGIVTFFNEFAENFFGFSRSEIIGKHVIGTVVPEKETTGRDLTEMVEDVMHHPENYVNNENENVKKNGEIVWVAWTNRTEFDAEGNLAGLLCVGVDTTERKLMEVALSESERRYRTTVASALDGFWLVGLDGRLLEVNDAYCKLSGYSRDELLNLKVSDIEVDEDPYEVAEHIQKIITSGSDRFETRHWTKNGKLLDLEISSTYTELAGGLFFSFIRDITDRKIVDEIMAKWAHIFEHIEWGVVIGSADGKSNVMMNPKFADMHGYDIAELTGTPVEKVIAPECMKDLPENIRKINERGHHSYESMHLRKDGSTFPILVDATVVKDQDGNVMYSVVNVQDITEKRRAEDKLNKIHSQLQTSIDNMPLAYILWDIDFKVIEWNESAERIFGYTKNEMLGKNPVDYIVPVDAREIVIEVLQKLGDGESSSYSAKNNNIRKDGASISCMWFNKSLLDQEGNVIGLLTMADDISVRLHAEEAIADEKKFTENAINTLIDTFFVFDMTNGKPIRWNNSLKEVSGYTDDEIANMKALNDWFSKKDLKKASVAIEKINQEGQATLEMSLITKSGNTIPTEFSSSVIKDNDGKPRFIITIGRDITERKQAEERLRQSEEKYRTYISNSPYGVFITDSNGKYVEVNDAASKLTGYTAEELLSRHIPDIISQEGQEDGLAHFNRLLKDGISTGEVLFQKKDGSKYTMSIDAVKLSDDRYMGFSHDVTERVLAEKSLRENELRLQQAVSAANLTIFDYFPFKKESIQSKEWYEITGYTQKEIAKNDELRNLIHPDDIGIVSKRMVDVIQGHSEHYFAEYRLKFKDGNYKWLQTIGRVIDKDEEGNVVRIIGVTSDINERKLSEVREKLHEQQLFQADKMTSLGILVSGVAHEINNPNHFIMTGASLIESAWKSIEPIIEKYNDENSEIYIGSMPYSEMRDEIPSIIEGIKDGAVRIKSIVGELRDFARQTPHDVFENVNLNAVITSSLVLLTNMIKMSTFNFSEHLDRDIPEMKGHFRRLEQVIINLVQNSCQSLTDKNQAISISTSYDKNADMVVFKVADEGSGITEEHMKRILDPFFTTKRDIGRSGLGLSITTSIVNEHGGTITFNSKHGESTEVTVSFPVVKI